MAAATSPAITPQAIADQIKGIGERLTPLEGLLKSLQQPASRAGVTPQELLSRMTAGENGSVIGTDGAAMARSRKMFGKRVGYQSAEGKGARFGDFLSSLYFMSDTRVPTAQREKCARYLDEIGVQKVIHEKDTVIKAALAESSGVTGGYTVPPMFAQELLRLAVEDAIIRPRAKKMPLTSRTLLVPYLDQVTAQTAGNPAFLGGVQATWTAEAATRTQSQPTFRQLELTAWELSFYSVASNTLLADQAVGLDSLLTELFSQAITWYTEYAYLRGTGVGQPLGVLNAPAALSVTRLVTSSIQYQDIRKMFGKIYSMLMKDNLIWLAHQSCVDKILGLNDASTSLGSGSTDSVGRPIFIPLSGGIQESVDQGQGPMHFGYLMGKPLFLTEKLPALGTKGDLMLIDPSYYILGDRMDLEIDVSPHVNFLTNQMTWRIVFRGDGQPWLGGAVTLADGSQTVSPFVVLN